MSKKPTAPEVVALYRAAALAHEKQGLNICATCEHYHSLRLSDECRNCMIISTVNYKERKHANPSH
jgi:hypothetical protein